MGAITSTRGEVLHTKYTNKNKEKGDMLVDEILKESSGKYTVVKCLAGQLAYVSDDTLKKFLHSFETVICIFRANIYDHMLSFAIAQAFSRLKKPRWHKYTTTTNDLPEFQKVSIIKDDVFSIHPQFNKYKRILQFLEGANVINIDYDKMSSMSSNELLTFCGIDTKQSYADQTEKLDSYDEKLALIENVDETLGFIEEYIENELVS